jgi:hypothetical protein
MNTTTERYETEEMLAESDEWQEIIVRLEDLASFGGLVALNVGPDDLDVEDLIKDIDALRAVLKKFAATKAALTAS